MSPTCMRTLYVVTGPKFSILTSFVYTAPIFLEMLFAGTFILGFIPKVEVYNMPMDVRLLTSFQVVCVSSPIGGD